MAPLLEQDIEALQTLDGHRERCGVLTADAAKAIIQWVHDAPNKDAYRHSWYSARDDVERAMILRALNTIRRESLLSLSEKDDVAINSVLEAIRNRLLNTTVKSLYNISDPEDDRSTCSYKFDKVPVFRACQIFQALAEDESAGPFCRASLNCLYRITVDIYRAGSPEWKIGGARASLEAPQSPFVTREVIRSILFIHKVLTNTAELIEELDEAKKAYTLATKAPEIWKKQDSLLRRRNFEISLTARWPHLLDRQMFKGGPAESESETWTAWAEPEIYRQLNHHWETFEAGRRLFSRPRPKQVTAEIHQKVQELATNIFDKLVGPHKGLKAVGEAMEAAADKVRLIVEPSKSYLESVLIAELSAEPGRSGVDPDAAQAAFAAAALAEIDVASGYFDRDDLRLLAATKLASARLSERNALPRGAPFAVSGDGYRLHPQGAETIRAICDMLRLSSANCDPETARRLVRYFLETRAELPETKRGWRMDVGTTDGNAAVSATALAFFALVELRTMLDQQINQNILRYFTIRYPKEIKLELRQLFLPDTASVHKKAKDSIGTQLQAMRAHAVGATSTDNNFSVVLYGPPGTGKSTLMEALARSSAAILVEITPSDILIGGSEQVERHTRLVFSALSMLTQCVILFDEFDSILRQRVRGAPLDEFQFLTPGLLPKLKQLHDRAAKQRLVYALATNFVVDLDRAAIRTGRFDQRFGVFPPDLLSRVGRLTVEMEKYCTDPQFSSGERTIQRETRAINIVKKAAGFGMATLGKPGWFTVARSDTQLDGTPFDFIFRDARKPDFGEREGKIGEMPDDGEDSLGTREWKRWKAINELDRSGKAIEAADWEEFVKQVSDKVEEWKLPRKDRREPSAPEPEDVDAWQVVAVLDIARVQASTDDTDEPPADA